MIVRKPYAFLIKHFRFLHVILFLLSLFLCFKNIQLGSFIREFSKLGTYDVYNEPITKYVSFWALFVILVIIVGSLILLFLLYHKKKAWKLYLVPIFLYSLMLLVFLSTKSFFADYDGTSQTASILALKDFILIVNILQYVPIILFFVRALGVDLKAFNFQNDAEYLELSESDRDELEIRLDFDKHSLKRNIKKFLRNLGYLYKEHKKIIVIFITLFIVLLLFFTYRFFFITNRVYKQGDDFNSNAYTITVNNAYYTDKDDAGNIISPMSSFVIVDMTVKNNYKERDLDLSKFHVINGISNYGSTYKTYGTEFKDFGKTYDSKVLRNNESFRQIMVFKVDNKLNPKKFVLYYQGFDNGTPRLKKIKLKINDVSKIEKNESLKLGDVLNVNLNNTSNDIIFDDYVFLDTAQYYTRSCEDCSTHTNYYTAPMGYKVLLISFASDDFESKDMIDFSTNYGKINYIDKDSKSHSLELKNPFNHKIYYGKYLYAVVPKDIVEASSIDLDFIVRNQEYIYKLR